MTTTTEDKAIAAIAKHSWNKELGSIKPNTPLSITYSFLTEKPAYYLSGWGVAILKARVGRNSAAYYAA